MSIFGKKTGVNPPDGSEVLLSKDFVGSGEELTEIEKARRDLMVARLESFKREAAEQTANESSEPLPTATEPQLVKPVPAPPKPPLSVRPVSTPTKPVKTEQPKKVKQVTLQPTGEVIAAHKSPVAQPPDARVLKEVPSKPVMPEKVPEGVNQPETPKNIPQEKNSVAGKSDSFITRSEMPRPSRKPPESVKEPAIPVPEKSILPVKPPEQAKPVSIDPTVSQKEKPTWRIKPKVELNAEIQIPEKKGAEESQKTNQEKPAWRLPPKVETKKEAPAPKKPETKESQSTIEKKPAMLVPPKMQAQIEELVNTKPIIEKPAIKTPPDEKSDSKPTQDVPDRADSHKAKESETQKTDPIAEIENTQVIKAPKPQITLPYGEVPSKTSPIEEIDKQAPEKTQEISPDYLEMPGELPKPAPPVSFKAADLKDQRVAKEAPKIPVLQARNDYPRSSGHYNHYDQYNQDRDKLIDDIMFGIVNADITARRRQMTDPESK